jgi:hypothetical protein
MALKWFDRPSIYFTMDCNIHQLRDTGAVNSFLGELADKKLSSLSGSTKNEIDREIKWLKQNRQDL